MTLMLIDGNGIFHAAYHITKANPAFRRDGLPNAAVADFISKIWWYLGQVARPYGVTHGAVVFDHPARNWRHVLHPKYKGTRPKQDWELKAQLVLARHVIPGMGMKTVRAMGYEADDVIATYVRMAKEAGIDALIVTSDKDMMQMIGPSVRVFGVREKLMVTDQDVIDKFGVPPHKICDVQALSGDTVDNVPGIAGIGAKGAAELILQFGDLETLLNNAELIKKPKLREKVQAGEAAARLSYRLVQLNADAPVPYEIDDLKLTPINASSIIACLNALEVVHFTKEFAYPFKIDPQSIEPDPNILDIAEDIMMARQYDLAV